MSSSAALTETLLPNLAVTLAFSVALEIDTPTVPTTATEAAIDSAFASAESLADTLTVWPVLLMLAESLMRAVTLPLDVAWASAPAPETMPAAPATVEAAVSPLREAVMLTAPVVVMLPPSSAVTLPVLVASARATPMAPEPTAAPTALD